eukprot:CAMPEP_0184688022 /NCGR_PEP_ID=MMETSP0312-20130426/28303_1 /TAXON_ID=31354 /ORGANISM="Compsopogon coeruleus, Strain SAG 36.94" /LENGTH=34 /DNA_ID= /DNA_START= /DNA_END= /DNA_ORIENTATION=
MNDEAKPDLFALFGGCTAPLEDQTMVTAKISGGY